MDKQDHTIWRGNPPRVLLTAKLDELHPLSIVAATHHQEQGAARYLPVSRNASFWGQVKLETENG